MEEYKKTHKNFVYDPKKVVYLRPEEKMREEKWWREHPDWEVYSTYVVSERHIKRAAALKILWEKKAYCAGLALHLLGPFGAIAFPITYPLALLGYYMDLRKPMPGPYSEGTIVEWIYANRK